MAERRMIARSISVSEQVAALESDFARLLFTWMIAHADDWGVMTGSAVKVRALVTPLLDRTAKEVETALADMERHELIWRYTDAGGAPLIQFRTWELHQQGLHKRTTPKHTLYKAPESAGDSKKSRELPENNEHSRNFPELPGNSLLTEQKGTELKGIGKGNESLRPGGAGESDAASAAGGASAPAGDVAPKPALKAFTADEEPYQLATQLRDAVLAHNPKATDAVKAKQPAGLQAWARQMETLARDKRRTAQEVAAIIAYAAASDFWPPYIINPASLKKKLDTIDGQRIRDSKAGGNGHVSTTQGNGRYASAGQRRGGATGADRGHAPRVGSEEYYAEWIAQHPDH